MRRERHVHAEYTGLRKNALNTVAEAVLDFLFCQIFHMFLARQCRVWLEFMRQPVFCAVHKNYFELE